ncbi:hypothetical protein [Halomicrobium sp. LC1Hm]|uniref:DUF7288 family protein n=1 Tax=Halomicrobium sp. LC1Hm TaxID=2610902 RepID=UPI0012984EF0|nr:hypothetical protein [Halomicrobium sp. LC1Hm]QGA82726.1 putative pilin/flagellin [Halomicrobium sp. LC1Hm]
MTRGQVYTLEGIFAALVIVVSVFFALQATTAMSGTPSGQAAVEGEDGLTRSTLSAIDDRTLRSAVLYWTDEGFHCTPSDQEYYTGSADLSTCPLSTGSEYSDDLPTNAFGAALAEGLGDAYQYNVVLRYESGTTKTQQMVYQGQPSAGATRARASVPLANDHQFTAADGTQSGTRLSDEPGRLYAPPTDGDASDDDLYTVVYVEVVAWQT